MATGSIAARSGLIALSTGASAGGSDAIAELRNVQLRVHRDSIDATLNDSSGWRELLPGTASWSGTAEALYVPTTSATQYKLRNALSSAASVAFLFQPSTAASGTYSWAGTGYVEDYDIGGNTNDAFLTNVTIQGTGALTESTST